jgi:hypothetical protein
MVFHAPDSFSYRKLQLPFAKWLDEKLKPLSVNEHTMSHPFEFSKEVCHGKSRMVKYFIYLVTSIPLNEIIHILADKAFENNWF